MDCYVAYVFLTSIIFIFYHCSMIVFLVHLWRLLPVAATSPVMLRSNDDVQHYHVELDESPLQTSFNQTTCRHITHTLFTPKNAIKGGGSDPMASKTNQWLPVAAVVNVCHDAA